MPECVGSIAIWSLEVVKWVTMLEYQQPQAAGAGADGGTICFLDYIVACDLKYASSTAAPNCVKKCLGLLDTLVGYVASIQHRDTSVFTEFDLISMWVLEIFADDSNFMASMVDKLAPVLFALLDVEHTRFTSWFNEKDVSVRLFTCFAVKQMASLHLLGEGSDGKGKAAGKKSGAESSNVSVFALALLQEGSKTDRGVNRFHRSLSFLAHHSYILDETTEEELASVYLLLDELKPALTPGTTASGTSKPAVGVSAGPIPASSLAKKRPLAAVQGTGPEANTRKKQRGAADTEYLMLM